MRMAEHTPQQKQVLAQLRKTYGSSTVKAFARSKANGRMRVELKSQAGIWTWIYDSEGTLVLKYLTEKLFDINPTPPKPRNAIHN